MSQIENPGESRDSKKSRRRRLPRPDLEESLDKIRSEIASEIFSEMYEAIYAESLRRRQDNWLGKR